MRKHRYEIEWEVSDTRTPTFVLFSKVLYKCNTLHEVEQMFSQIKEKFVKKQKSLDLEYKPSDNKSSQLLGELFIIRYYTDENGFESVDDTYHTPYFSLRGDFNA